MPDNVTAAPVSLSLNGPTGDEEIGLDYLGSDRFGEWFGAAGPMPEVMVFSRDWWWGRWTLDGPRPKLARGPRAGRSMCIIAPPATLTRTEDETPTAVAASDLGLRIVSGPEEDARVEGENLLASDLPEATLRELRLAKHRQFAVMAAFEEPFRYRYARWGQRLL